MAINDKIKLIEQNEESIYSRLSKCDICPRNCKINRIKGEGTYCGTKKNLIIYTVLLHPGEEPAISGKKGSGTCQSEWMPDYHDRWSTSMEASRQRASLSA